MPSFVVFLIVGIICRGAFSQPLIKRDNLQPLETQIIDAATAVPAGLSEGQAKATGQGGIPQAITGAMPTPVKDIIPGSVPSSGNYQSSATPTLFLGGFSILMMPMPNGLSGMQQMMETAPNLINMAPAMG